MQDRNEVFDQDGATAAMVLDHPGQPLRAAKLHVPVPGDRELLNRNGSVQVQVSKPPACYVVNRPLSLHSWP
jgi:hypothetical protein